MARSAANAKQRRAPTAGTAKVKPKGQPARKAKTKDPSTLGDRALELIRNDIISGALRPGEVINAGTLCERYGIGRTPVHQAIGRLQIQGLVEVLPRKGTIVRSVSFDEIIQLAEARLINELEVARLAAARITREEVAHLRALAAEMELAQKDLDVRATMALDREFHEAIHQAARNPILADFLKSIYDRSMRVWYVSMGQSEYFEGLHVEHRALIDALDRGDADGAAEAIKAHIMSYRNNLRRQI